MRHWRGIAPTQRRQVVSLVALSLVAAMTGCSLDFGPTHAPTASPVSAAEAEQVAIRYLDAWVANDYAGMWKLIAPQEQQSTTFERYRGLHEQFVSLAGVTGLQFQVGQAQQATAPALTGASGAASASAPAQSGMEVPVSLDFATSVFGALHLQRTVDLRQTAAGFQVRWSPALLFPALGADGSFALSSQPGPRGRIIAADGTVFAETRSDGMRIYPQETLAGQTIGYVGRVTAAELTTLGTKGYRVGDWIGRSGLELGAEDLLRGTPAFTLTAVNPARDPVPVEQSTMVPGATLTISIRPAIQRAAEAAMARYPRVASATVDPRNGEILALASLPLFDPNAMSLGTTLRGVPLARPGKEQITNKAVMGAYPAGSDFKPFTLGAALQTGTVTTATRMLCPGTWTFEGFTYQNWMRETLPGLRTWADTMALSCNTTYMPLSVLVYNRDQTALTDLLHQFGFGEPTGVDFLAEAAGRLPDAAYFATNPRWNGKMAPYGPADQVQLAIGQGEYLGTALQLAMAYAAWGNRGTLWEPRLVLKAARPDGTVVYESQPTVHHAIGLSKPVMDFVVNTIRAVVTSPLGTAYRAFAGFPIAVAGKSGTAETGGPDPDAWFPAFAPMNNPTIAVATVVVTVPLGTGGDFAAPITRKIMEAYFLH